MSLIELSAGAVGTGAVAITIMSSLVTPDNATAIAGAVVLIIGAIGAAAVAIIKALRETKAINQNQSAKLDQITYLVDGRFTSILQELADHKRLLAEITGVPSDRVAAEKAQSVVEKHISRASFAPIAPPPSVEFDKSKEKTIP